MTDCIWRMNVDLITSINPYALSTTGMTFYTKLPIECSSAVVTTAYSTSVMVIPRTQPIIRACL